MINRRRISWPKDKPLKLTAPKPYIPKEYEAQEEVFLWAHGRPAERYGRTGWTSAIPAQCKDPRIALLFSTLNGVRLPPGLARKMKRAGNRQGITDILLDVVVRAPDGNIVCPGLRIELKREKGGTVSAEQAYMHSLLRLQGFHVEVAKGARHAIEIIELYLAR